MPPVRAARVPVRPDRGFARAGSVTLDAASAFTRKQKSPALSTMLRTAVLPGRGTAERDPFERERVSVCHALVDCHVPALDENMCGGSVGTHTEFVDAMRSVLRRAIPGGQVEGIVAELAVPAAHEGPPQMHDAEWVTVVADRAVVAQRRAVSPLLLAGLTRGAWKP